MTTSATSRPGRRAFLKGMVAGGLLAACPVQTAGAPSSAPVPVPTETVFTTCDMCFNRCGVAARVTGQGKERRILKLDGNPHCSKSRGMLCARGNAAIAMLDPAERLTTPLLRTGKRGENKWKSISWEEAYTLMADKLRGIARDHTPCGMLFTPGADTHSQFVKRFAEAYGSFNVTTHESLCLLSGHRAFMDTFGEVPQPDLLHCDYAVMLGANRFEALVMPDTADAMQAMRRGAQLIVLDPRPTKTARLANEWYAIRPGTDLAFLLAVAHVIIHENLYDRAWVEAHTTGLEQLAEHVRSCTPQWAAAETDIPAEAIIRIARGLAAAAPRSMIYPGRRTSDYVDSTQIRRAFAIVNALLANYDRKGGLMSTPAVALKGYPLDAPWYDHNQEDRVDAAMAPMLFKAEGAFVLTREAILAGKPYPVKGWFLYKTNPLGTAPDRARTLAMMEKLDFIVCMDVQLSDTAFMSDLVLPAPFYLERDDPYFVVQGGPAGPAVMTRSAVVPAPGQCKPAFEVMQELARRLDLADCFNFSLAELKARQEAGLPGLKEATAEKGLLELDVPLYGLRAGQPFKTPSGRIELFSQQYADKGLDPMPVYQTPAKAPQDRPFRLVAGRSAAITQSASTNNPLLFELEPGNTLDMAPEAATALGLRDGDMVRVTSSVGEECLRLAVVPGMRADTVYMHTGYGGLSPARKRVHGVGGSIVALQESAADAICGNSAIHTTYVRVTRHTETV
ncbi:MAG: molybdopterin-dependent oxidoreductase [Desulfovibrio sp.]|nr:molybdopterin-dependent oxidoreductase [Desulfovibrio sp.]